MYLKFVIICPAEQSVILE